MKKNNAADLFKIFGATALTMTLTIAGAALGGNSAAFAATQAEQLVPIAAETVIVADGAKQIMTRETMSAWIEKRFTEAREAIERGEYSEANLEIERQEYAKYTQAIEEGKTVTLYTTSIGTTMFDIDEGENTDGDGVTVDINMNNDGAFEFIFGDE